LNIGDIIVDPRQSIAPDICLNPPEYRFAGALEFHNAEHIHTIVQCFCLANVSGESVEYSYTGGAKIRLGQKPSQNSRCQREMSVFQKCSRLKHPSQEFDVGVRDIAVRQVPLDDFPEVRSEIEVNARPSPQASLRKKITQWSLAGSRWAD
jgi:hypothetical protein